MSEDRCEGLFEVAGKGDVERLQQLLATGIDAAQIRNGKSVLHVAASSEHISLCKVLLEHGVDANIRDADGRTPLGYALERAAGGAMLLGSAFGGGFGRAAVDVGKEKSQKLVDLFESYGGKAPRKYFRILGLKSKRKWWQFWK